MLINGTPFQGTMFESLSAHGPPELFGGPWLPVRNFMILKALTMTDPPLWSQRDQHQQFDLI